MTPLETDVEKSFLRKLKALGKATGLDLRAAKLKALGNRGWSDRLIPIPGGKSVYIEFKRPGKEDNTSFHQDDVLGMLKGHGCPVLVTSSADEAIEFVKEMIDAAQTQNSTFMAYGSRPIKA